MTLYINEHSPIHSLDPRTKIILLFYITFAALFVSYKFLPFHLMLFLLTFFLAVISKSIMNLYKVRFLMLSMLLFTTIVWGIAREGSQRIVLIFTLNGIGYGLITSLKLITIIMISIIFMSTTKIEEITLGMIKLKVPYRVAFAFSTAIRFIPMIMHIATTTMQAQKSRGLCMDEMPFFKRVKCYAYLLIPVFTSVIKCTNTFAISLESKGFGHSETRTNYRRISFQRMDGCFFLIMVLTTPLLMYLVR